LGEEEEIGEDDIFRGEAEFEDEDLTPQISINAINGH